MRLMLVAILMAMLAGPLPAHALEQEAAARLDSLFAALHEQQDPLRSRLIEAQIWAVWATNSTTDAVADLSAASAEMGNGAFDRAEEKLNALIARHPDFAEAWNRRATLYFQQGRFAESLLDIAHVLDLEPRHFGALSGKSMCLGALGNTNTALKAMKEAYAINPNLSGLKDHIEALEKLNPDL